MNKWKCEVCGKGFDNFHAQGFDNKIYCPLCFFKKENKQLKEQRKQRDEVIDETIKFARDYDFAHNNVLNFYNGVLNRLQKLKEDSSENANLKKALSEIREFIKSQSPDAGVSGHYIMEKIDKYMKEDDQN